MPPASKDFSMDAIGGRFDVSGGATAAVSAIAWCAMSETRLPMDEVEPTTRDPSLSKPNRKGIPPCRNPIERGSLPVKSHSKGMNRTKRTEEATKKLRCNGMNRCMEERRSRAHGLRWYCRIARSDAGPLWLLEAVGQPPTERAWTTSMKHLSVLVSFQRDENAGCYDLDRW